MQNSVLSEELSKLTLFNEEEKNHIEKLCTIDEKNNIKIKCQIRNKDIKATPEELVRQLYLYKLMKDYKYKPSDIVLESEISFGREKKRADIVINNKDGEAKIIIELKKSKEKEGKEQLKSYTNATGAPLAVWTNGIDIEYWHRKDPNYFESIKGIPEDGEKLSDYLNEPFTLLDLMIEDRLLEKNITLKKIIKDMEDEVLANAGVNVFEEGFKLIFTKLYDEFSVISKDKTVIYTLADIDENEPFTEKIKKLKELKHSNNSRLSKLKKLSFYNYGDDNELKRNINILFEDAQKEWKNVFPENSTISLSASHLAVCVSSLQKVKLFNSNLEVIDEAFEYLINKDSKGEKGQYFTPRHVIDMCVKMLNPHKNESMIDTAAGSCGFPVHTWFNMIGHLFDGQEPDDNEKKFVKNIFGLDFDERAVRVARTLNLIAGDGETNVLHINTLDYDKKRWDEKRDSDYREAFNNLIKHSVNKDDYKLFDFCMLLANPPFAGEIKEHRILAKYEIAKKGKKSVGRDILFIERNLDFVRDGGRLALVLPQGRFNNATDEYIRDFISEKARILAVVGLHGNTFKPHTGTKTSVIFLQKWNNDDSDPLYYCPKVEDYPIFFAVSEKAGKDNSGEYVYAKDKNGNEFLDKHGHKIKDHDLHNHDGSLDDGIAEAFIEFAKEKKLSFWSY